MAKKTNGKNGSGNGHDKDDDSKGVIEFPSLAQRDAFRKEKLKEEKAYRKEYSAARKAAASAENPPFFNAGKLPRLTRNLVLLFIAVQLPLYLALSPAARFDVFYNFGFVPGRLTGAESFLWYTPLTLFTHIFIHGSWMHLAFNAVMTLAMGAFFEKQYGAKRMAIFFAFSAIAGVLFQTLFSPFSSVPIIGASGAISGLFGVALLTLFEQGQMGQMGKRGVWPILFFWGALMAGLGLLAGDSVAWQAHLGGYIGGLGLFFAMRKGIVKF